MEILNCVFSDKITWEGIPPENKTDFWQFSEMICFTTTSELIQNPETNAEFYLTKTINYGEVLILVFLLLFAIFGIVKIIGNFFIPQKVDIRKP